MKKHLLCLVLLFFSVMLKAQMAFITVWDLSKPGSGSSQISFSATVTDAEAIYTWTTIPAGSSGSGTLSVGTNSRYITGLPANAKIELSIASNNLKKFAIDYGSDRQRLIDITQWGDAAWTSMNRAFYGAINLTGFSATDVPNLTLVTDMNMMFASATSFNGDLSKWNTGSVVNMSSLFIGATSFNGDLSSWNTSAVTNMGAMFAGASSFNSDVSRWNVESVNNMTSMFSGASSFNQNLASWSLNSTVTLNFMLDHSGLDCSNYSATLLGWAANSETPNGRSLGASGRRFGTNAAIARGQLVSKGWTISDAGSSGFACTDNIILAFSQVNPTYNIAPNTMIIDDALVITTAKNLTLAGATISVSKNFNPGDILSFSPNTAYGNITGTYNAVTGVLSLFSLNATATVMQWQAALRSIGFATAATPNLVVRDISFTLNDGTLSSDEVIKKVTVQLTPPPFVTVWDLSKQGSGSDRISFYTTIAGSGASYTWTTIPAGSSGSGTFPAGNSISATISGLPANQKIALSIHFANLKAISLSNTSDSQRLVDVSQWGGAAWTSMAYAFRGATNLTGFSATDAPDLSGVKNMAYMFANADSFNGDLSNWNTSSVTNMEAMFSGAKSFNGNLSRWNTASVTNMRSMFYDAYAFNQDISGWSTGAVTNMGGMFQQAYAFNSPIGNWNVSSVSNFTQMLYYARSFNQDLGNWIFKSSATVGNLFGMSAMNCTNYSATLIGWAANPNTPNNISLNASGQKYGTNAVAARTNLLSRGWSVTYDSNSGFNCTNELILRLSEDITAYTVPTPVAVDNNLVITNANTYTLASATVSISGNFYPGDVLSYSSSYLYGYITGSYDAERGVLTLTSADAKATIAQWEAALRSITFNTSATPNTAVRGISFVLNSGSETSTEVVKNISIAQPPLPFITVWDLSKPGGSPNQIQFTTTVNGAPVAYSWTTIPAGASGNGIITMGTVTTNITGLPTNAKIALTITSASLKGFTIYNTSGAQRLVDVAQWGEVAWTSMRNAFYGAKNLTGFSATDVPNLSAVQDMSGMFRDASSFNGDLSLWNTASVTNMETMFYSATSFNGDLSTWNTASVTNMSGMFYYANSFNKNLSAWETATVTDMSNMFYYATSFNKKLDTWKLNPNVILMNIFTLSGLDCAAYSATLIGWAASPSLPIGRALGASGIYYGTNATAARAYLGSKGWYIQDSGSSQVDCTGNLILTTGALETVYNAPIAVKIDNAVTIAETDNRTLASATVSIINNFNVGDELSFNDNAAYGNIIGSFNAATGVLSLSSAGATATVTQWETALRSITFNTAAMSHSAARTVSFIVASGNVRSAAVTKTITVVLPGVLPVTLTNFTVKAESNKALLQWKTTAEKDNSHFIIERSADGSNFAEIARKSGKGTTSLAHNYNAYDHQPLPGANYYRLLQVDHNGKTEILGLRTLQYAATMSYNIVYPNPTVTENVNVTIGGYKAATVMIKIADILGRTVHIESLRITDGINNYKLNIKRTLPPGQYLLSFKAQDISQTVKLLIK